MLPGFVEERREVWTGETLPVVFDGDRTCRRCGFGIVVQLEPWTAVPLFIHGGYGEAVRRTVSACLACGRASEVSRETVNPRFV